MAVNVTRATQLAQELLAVLQDVTSPTPSLPAAPGRGGGQSVNPLPPNVEPAPAVPAGYECGVVRKIFENTYKSGPNVGKMWPKLLVSVFGYDDLREVKVFNENLQAKILDIRVGQRVHFQVRPDKDGKLNIAADIYKA